MFTHLRKVLVYIKWSRYELAGNILGRSYVSVHKHKTAVERRIGGRNFRRIKIIIASVYCMPSVSSVPYVLPSYTCFILQNTTLCFRFFLNSLIFVAHDRILLIPIEAHPALASVMTMCLRATSSQSISHRGKVNFNIIPIYGFSFLS